MLWRNAIKSSEEFLSREVYVQVAREEDERFQMNMDLQQAVQSLYGWGGEGSECNGFRDE